MASANKSKVSHHHLLPTDRPLLSFKTLTRSFQSISANARILFPEESNLEIIMSKDGSKRHLDQALVVRTDLSKTLLTGEASELGVHALELLYNQTARLIHDHLSNPSKVAEASRVAQAEDEKKATRATEEQNTAKEMQQLQDKVSDAIERMLRLEQNVQHLQEYQRVLTPTTATTEATPTEVTEASFFEQGARRETRRESSCFNVQQLERLIAMYTEAIASTRCEDGESVTLSVTTAMEDFLATVRQVSR